MSLDKMKKVGELIDMYLAEIWPNPSLSITKFLGAAESLSDCARDSFDQVYRAIAFYLQVITYEGVQDMEQGKHYLSMCGIFMY
ncbi:hypothetical protein ACS0TY_026126 [Phlomoides rotata]